MLVELIILGFYHSYYAYQPLEDEDEEAEYEMPQADENDEEFPKYRGKKIKYPRKHRTTALLYSFLLGTFGADWFD